MATDWGAWSQGWLFPSKVCLWQRKPGRKGVIFLAARDLGVSDTKWDGSICCCFFPFWLLLITGGVRRLLSAGPRRGERVYVPMYLLRISGAIERVELFMQHSWQKKISLIWGCWRVDGSTKIQKETISEFLLNYAAWKEDVLWALWPHWSTLTPQSDSQPLQPVLNSRLSPLGPTSQGNHPARKALPSSPQPGTIIPDGQTDTPVPRAGLQTLRGRSRNNVHFNAPVAETDLNKKQGN